LEKEVSEEFRSVAQGGALALRAPQLLKESKGYDLRVRKLLQALVAPSVEIEVLVEIVHQAEQNGDRLCLRERTLVHTQIGPSSAPLTESRMVHVLLAIAL
jgi:hypothetical protein